MARLVIPGDQSSDAGIPSTLERVMRIESSDGGLSADGHPLRIKGVTWWGAESADALPAGLQQRSMDDLLSFVARNDFNTLRLPILHQHILFDEPIPAGSFSPELNPFLAPGDKPVRYREMLRLVCKRAAQHGLLVWLVAHSRDRLWYSRSISEETTMDSWTVLAQELCPQWNVIAADLKNKPGGASWGLGLNSDWDKAAARLGDHVLNNCKRWLVVVEGVGQQPGADQDAEMEFTAMHHDFLDGENLVGVSTHPVVLKDSSKLVYGAHAYGPGFKMLPYMGDDEYPEVTEQVWQEHFLYLRKASGGTVVLNMGGPYECSVRDRLFQDWAVKFCARNGINVFYDGLNPLTGLGGSPPGEAEEKPGISPSTLANNTGGLLKPDWTSAWNDKLQLLAQLPVTRVSTLLSSIPFTGVVSHPPPPPPWSGDYPEWLRPAPPPSPPPPPPPMLQCGVGCAFGMMFLFVLVPMVAARVGLVRHSTLRRILHGLPGPLKGLLATLLGIDLSVTPVSASPRTQDVEWAEEEEAEPESHRGKRKKGKSKKKEKRLLLTDKSLPSANGDGSTLGEGDDDGGERQPLRQKASRKASRQGESRHARSHAEPAPSEDGGGKAGKSSRDKKSRGLRESQIPAPRSKGRSRSGKGLADRDDDGDADDGFEPVGFTSSRNQFRKFAEEEEEEGHRRVRRLAPVD